MCWLPALDSGGLDDLRYNVYLYDTSLEEPFFERVNEEMEIRSVINDTSILCHDAPIINDETSYGVVVVSANGATGDPENFTDVSEVQDRFVVFFVALGGDQQCSGKFG